jgi:hypothetical protein
MNPLKSGTLPALSLLFFTALSLLPGLNQAHAGDRLDIVLAMDQKDYCEIVADEFYAGVIGKLYGSAREFKPTTKSIIENLEHGIPLPKDALYVVDWDNMSERDKAFVQQHVLLGYDEAAKIGRDLTDEETKAMGKAYFDRCMMDRLTAVDDSPFKKVEALENVNPAKRIAMCSEWLADYKFIALAIKHGRDCDDMKDWTRNTEGVQEARRAKISRLLDEACGHDPEAWYETYAKKCMGIESGGKRADAPPPDGEEVPVANFATKSDTEVAN